MNPSIWLYVPFPNFQQSAKALDDMTLHAQINNGLAIVNRLFQEQFMLEEEKEPTVLMWHGYEQALIFYLGQIESEYELRGHSEHLYWKFIASHYQPRAPFILPWWFGDPEVHYSHQSTLLRRDYTFYHQQFPSTPCGLKLVWKEGVPMHTIDIIDTPCSAAPVGTDHLMQVVRIRGSRQRTRCSYCRTYSQWEKVEQFNGSMRPAKVNFTEDMLKPKLKSELMDMAVKYHVPTNGKTTKKDLILALTTL